MRLPLVAVLASLVLASAPAHAARTRRAPEPDTQVASDPGALPRALEKLAAANGLTRARVSLLVEEADTGKVVFARGADELVNPASNVKLFTAATALARLGPAYRWKTELFTDGPLDPKGEVKALWIRGSGDPLISTERMWGMAGDIARAGVKSISGVITLDEGFFDEERVGPGYDQEQSDRAYMAPAGALSVNANAIEIDVFPAATVGQKARVELEPPSDHFTLDVKATTVREGDRGRVVVRLLKDGDRQKIEVSGRVPMGKVPTQLWRRVEDPGAYFARTLLSLLEKRGVKVESKKLRIVRGNASSKLTLLASFDSEPLDLAVRKMDKVSSNFIAEQLLKTLGAEVKGVPGSWPKGVAAVEEFLEKEVGITRGSYVMRNGSGLNDTNRFSARQLNKLLAWVAGRFPMQAEFASSLAIAGRDGTLRGRLEQPDTAARVRAKTGTLDGVSALSGYTESQGGQRFLFSLLVNDYPGRHAQAVAAIDDLVATVIATGGAIGPEQLAKERSEQPEVRPSPVEELRARSAAFCSLGAQKDKRNGTFLRLALRAERDPALRAVIADAAWRSDTTDGAAARQLLDLFTAKDEVFGRLRTACRDQGVRSAPGVASVLDLAAEGTGDALTRTLELAALSAGDVILEDELAEGLDQIARSAPEELLATLRASTPETRDRGRLLLCRGLARSTEGETPLPKALDKLQKGKDAEAAAWARGFSAELQKGLAEARVIEAAALAAAAADGGLPDGGSLPLLLPDGGLLAPSDGGAVPELPPTAPPAPGPFKSAPNTPGGAPN